MDVCFFYLLNFLYISNPVNRCFTMSCTLYTCLAFFIVVQPTCGSVQLSKQEMRSSRHGSEHAWYSLRSAMVEEAVSVPHWSSSAQLSNESEQLVRQATVPCMECLTHTAISTSNTNTNVVLDMLLKEKRGEL